MEVAFVLFDDSVVLDDGFEHICAECCGLRGGFCYGDYDRRVVATSRRGRCCSGLVVCCLVVVGDAVLVSGFASGSSVRGAVVGWSEGLMDLCRALGGCIWSGQLVPELASF